MRLAILNLTGGGMSGGHVKYLQNMLPALASLPEIEGVLCASPKSTDVLLRLPPVNKVSYVPCEPFRPFWHEPDAALARTLDGFVPDIIFIPVERYINYKNLPVVVMLQNMAPLAGVKTGDGFKEFLVSFVRRYETRLALEMANSVIVPTAYVKDFLLANSGLPEDKVTPIHYGRNPISSSPRPPAGFPKGQFVFTAGSLEAYRGLEDLLLAFPALKSRKPGIKLCIAGGARPANMSHLKGLKRLAGSLGIIEDVVWLGNIPEEELSWCYSNCAVFVVTSRVESFCFVALEAMAHGCHIVSTESACLPEIFGPAADYYPVGNHACLGEKLSAALELAWEGRAARAAVAISRAESFAWGKAAADTLGVFKKTLKNT